MAKKKQHAVLESLTLAFKLSQLWENFLDQYLKATNITIKQYLLLLTIRDKFENSPVISQLADKTASSHQNIKQITIQLKNKGYVQLKKDATDKRFLRVHMTTSGNEFIESHMNGITKAFTKIFKKEKLKNIERFNSLLGELIDQSQKRLHKISG